LQKQILLQKMELGNKLLNNGTENSTLWYWVSIQKVIYLIFPNRILQISPMILDKFFYNFTAVKKLFCRFSYNFEYVLKFQRFSFEKLPTILKILQLFWKFCIKMFLELRKFPIILWIFRKIFENWNILKMRVKIIPAVGYSEEGNLRRANGSNYLTLFARAFWKTKKAWNGIIPAALNFLTIFNPRENFTPIY